MDDVTERLLLFPENKHRIGPDPAHGIGMFLFQIPDAFQQPFSQQGFMCIQLQEICVQAPPDLHLHLEREIHLLKPFMAMGIIVEPGLLLYDLFPDQVPGYKIDDPSDGPDSTYRQDGNVHENGMPSPAVYNNG